MTKKGLFNWSVWIGLMGGIYCAIYASSPIFSIGVMWMTFVALPIYFNGGAKKAEYFDYVASMVAGVVWGAGMLYFIGILSNKGVPINSNMGVIVGGGTILCCAIHFCLTGNFLFNRVPMMFGAMACTFSQGGKNLPFIIITMFCGITLGLIMQEGSKLLNEDGTWKFLSKNVKKEVTNENV